MYGLKDYIKSIKTMKIVGGLQKITKAIPGGEKIPARRLIKQSKQLDRIYNVLSKLEKEDIQEIDDTIDMLRVIEKNGKKSNWV